MDSIPFLKYKNNEDLLKTMFLTIDVIVRIEPITDSDNYYTDGDSTSSECKIIITGGNTIYVPQMIYNVNPQHKKIIYEFINIIKSQG